MDSVKISNRKLEAYINQYMDNMIKSTDGLVSIQEAKNLTMRNCRVFIKRYDE